MISKEIKALIIEDSEDDIQLMLREFKKSSYKILYSIVENEKELENSLKEDWDVIISDYALPGFSGYDALIICNKKEIDIPFIVVSGTIGEDIAVKMMKSGARDYIMKDNLSRLLPAIEREIEDSNNRRKKKQIEKEFIESEERYRKVVDISPEAIIIHCDGKIVFANPAAVKLSSAKNFGELLHKSAIEFVHPDEREFVRNRISEIIKSGKPSSWYEERFIKLDGNMIYVETIGSPTTYKGNPAVQTIIRDITERKLAEETIRKSEEKWRSLVNASPDFIALHDVEGRFLFLNHYADGFSEKKVVGSPVVDYVAEEYKEIFRKKFDACLNTMTTQKFQHSAMGDNGALKIYEEYFVPLIENNKVVNILAVAKDITENKKAEEALLSSQKLIEGIINVIPVRVFWKDRNLNYLGCNQAFVKDSGFNDVQDIIGKDDFKMGWIDQAEIYRKDDLQVIESGISKLHIEEPQTAPDGKTITLLTSKIPLKNSKGEIDGVLGIYVDITERKQMEEALRKSQQDWKGIFNGISHPTVILDSQNNVLEVNDSLKKKLGKNPSEIKRLKCWEIFHTLGTTHSPENCPFTKMISSGSQVTSEQEMEAFGGYYLINCTPIFDDNGKLEKVIHIATDITERKLFENELKASEEKYRNLIQTMPLGFYRTTSEGYFLDVNPALVKMFGYDSKEELMKIFIPDELYFSREERIHRNYSNNNFVPNSELYRLKKKDGSEVWVEDYSRYIKDSSGNVIQHEGIMWDVTESLKAKNAIIAAKDKAEEMNRLKSTFLANMSHEIRTPLSGIIGFASIMQDELTDATHLNYVNIIERSGKRLLETLDLILNFAKLEAEKEQVSYSNVNIQKIIDESVETFDAMAKIKNINLKSFIKIENTEFKSDERIVRQILNNLVNNAIKFTKEGSVTIELSKDKKYIILKVIDTGIGIAKENYQNIFEDFRQESEGYNRNFEGTGLGLAITKRFTKMLKGQIDVESEIGKGSVFTVKLPYEIFDENINNGNDNFNADEKMNKDTLIEDERLSILIVEDDENNRALIETILSNHNLKSVPDGISAIKLSKERNFDVILMDINLGKGIDGIKTVQEIRALKNYSSTPIVAITAYQLEGDREEFLSKGCTHYLGKPFKMNELLNLINNISKEIKK